MNSDIKLIRQKLRQAKKLPDNNPKEYNLKMDIIRHWRLEEHCQKMAQNYERLKYEN
jgi:hypothetical protein